jgi:hypothetical protein
MFMRAQSQINSWPGISKAADAPGYEVEGRNLRPTASHQRLVTAIAKMLIAICQEQSERRPCLTWRLSGRQQPRLASDLPAKGVAE